MAIVKMKHLRVIAVAEEQEALLNELLHVGCVEVSTPEEHSEEWAKLLERPVSAQNQVRADLGALNNALDALNKYAPAKGSLLATRPCVTEEQLFDQAAADEALAIAGEINEAADQIGQAISNENRLQSQRAGFLPWIELDLPLEKEATDQTELVLGGLPLNADLNAICLALQEQAPLSELIQVSEDREQRYVLLMCHKADFQNALTALKPCAFTQIRFRGVKGTASENLRQIEQQLDAELAKKEGAIASIVAKADKRDQLKLIVDRLTQDAWKEVNRERLLCTDKTFLLEGWVPEENEADLVKVLENHVCAWELEVPAKEDYEKVPVKLKNNWFSAPLNMVTEMYSLPKYGSLDPNPLMAPFFVLFYGMMMADMGYALLMLAAGAFLMFKLKAKGGTKNLAGLLLLCGTTTLIFGALTGGFFGDFLPQLAKLINPNTTFTGLPYLFSPLEDTMAILVGALLLGVVQYITGMIVGFYKKCRDGDALSAILDEGAWWVIYAGVICMILGVGIGTILLVAGLVMLVIGNFRTGGIAGAITGTFGAIYNGATGILSDVLSYSRLMALMLSGSIVASAFNTLGAVPGNVFVFIIISMVGNGLNFILNILGCYVHDLRLQCLEFFGHFYEDGGIPFKPLAINTKYVDIIKEEN